MLSSTSPGVSAAAVSHGPRQSFDGEILSKLIATASASLDGDRATAKDCIQRAADLLQVLRQERLPAQRALTFVRGGLASWQQRQVAAYVEANISANIRATDLARVARLSKSHFSRAFRKSFGERPMTYVLNQRIQHGQELMRKSRASLCEIAGACGMCDQSHFTRVFHRVVGVSPGLWRRQFASGLGVVDRIARQDTRGPQSERAEEDLGRASPMSSYVHKLEQYS
jgi:AraC family transcriptional regulator